MAKQESQIKSGLKRRTSHELTARILHVTARHFMLRSTCRCHNEASDSDRSRRKSLVLLKGLVLPDRIELSTSPLPMECSTTELRQRAPDTRIGQRPLQGAPILATR